MNHEEFHAESILDGNESEDKNEKDHEKYYGEYRSDSPNDSDVKNDPKYKNTEARKQQKEIDEIIQKEKGKDRNLAVA